MPYAVFLYVALAKFASGEWRIRNRFRTLTIGVMIVATLLQTGTRTKEWLRYLRDLRAGKWQSLQVLEGRISAAAIRRHIQVGRPVLFLYPEEEVPVPP